MAAARADCLPCGKPLPWSTSAPRSNTLSHSRHRCNGLLARTQVWRDWGATPAARRGRYYAAALSPSWPPCMARRFQYSPARAVLCGRPVALLATLHRAQVPVQPVADAAEPVVGDADVAHGRHRVL